MSVPVPQFSLPFSIRNGEAEVIEQDSNEEITQCVRTVLSYPQGSRSESPEFGMSDQVFLQKGASIAEIEAAIEQWEPRAQALVEADAEFLNELVSQVEIQVRGGN